MAPRIAMKGRTFGEWTVLDYWGLRGTRHHWTCRCSCGTERTIDGNNLRHGLSTQCTTCRNLELRNKRFCGVGALHLGEFSGIRRTALSRGLHLDLSIDDLWTIFESQDHRCALTGESIEFSHTRLGVRRGETTASLDRIDSAQGYTLDNVQWVHKYVNIMKRDMPQGAFVAICSAVAQTMEGAV